MVVTEKVIRYGEERYRSYSDAGMYIRKAGTDEVYAEAVDVKYTEYVETDKEIEDE
jgi:hypothetical protein